MKVIYNQFKLKKTPTQENRKMSKINPKAIKKTVNEIFSDWEKATDNDEEYDAYPMLWDRIDVIGGDLYDQITAEQMFDNALGIK